MESFYFFHILSDFRKVNYTLINQPHFADLYDNWEEGIRDGKEFINHMEARRKNPITMREIMWKDKELGEWYDSI